MTDDVPTPQEFRDIGFTADAVNYPHSEVGFLWLCKFNGLTTPEQIAKVPRSWRYASSEYMRQYIERRASSSTG